MINVSASKWQTIPNMLGISFFMRLEKRIKRLSLKDEPKRSLIAWNDLIPTAIASILIFGLSLSSSATYL